jgi:hypothetical protein
LESDDVKKALLAKFIRESIILNREFEPNEFEAYFIKLLENDSDGKFKECLLEMLPSSNLLIVYQKSISKTAITKEFLLEVLKKIFNQNDNVIKQIFLPFILTFDDLNHLDFICNYIIANPLSSNNLLQDKDYEDSQNLAELFIKSRLSYEQKLSLVKTILTDENFDKSTKNEFFSAILKNQEFLERFIDEDSVQELLLAWNFDNLDESNLFLALKQISSIQEEGRDRHTKLLSKILKSILTSTNIEFDVRIGYLSSMLFKSKEIPLGLIHEYFMNNSLTSIKGLTDSNIINKLIELIVNSKFDDEKKSSLITKFLSEKISDNESFDAEIKKNIFISLFRNEEFALKFIEEGSSIYYFAIYKQYLPDQYQKIRIIRTTINKETQTQIDHQNSTQGTQTKEVQTTGIQSTKVNTGISTLNQRIQTNEDLRGLPSASNPIGANSESSLTEIGEAMLLSASTSPPKSIKTKQASFKEPSSEDYERLSKLLSGAVLDGIRKVQSYNPNLETITAELKQFNINFTRHNPFGNEGLTADQDLARLFHSWFDPLFDKISNADFRGDKDKLKTYLYAILCISSGESESIVKFYNYYDYFINKNSDADVKFGTGHGSWISTPEQYSKLKVIIRKLDELVDTKPDILTKENLNAWLKCQFQDRRIKNFRFRENEEFIINLIKSLDIEPSDSKAKELTETRIDLQDFLKPNAIFLQNLVEIVNQVDHENKRLADYLFEHLIAKITPPATEVDQHTNLVNTDKLCKIEELKKNFNDKITKFIDELDSNIKPDFLDDPYHQLIVELILEIPIDLQDFLKSKLNQDLADKKVVNIRASAVSGKISNFIKSLESQDPNDQRKSIVEFRETCLEQSQIYSQKARELRELRSPAKTSASR